jgi:hypothetical protein
LQQDMGRRIINGMKILWNSGGNRHQIQQQAISIYVFIYFPGPFLWFSGRSSWLYIQRSRVRFPALPVFLRSSGSWTGSNQPREDNWGYISRKLRLRSRKVRLTTVGFRCADHVTPLCAKVGTKFVDKRRSLGRYNSLVDYKPRSLFCFWSQLQDSNQCANGRFFVTVNATEECDI